MSSNKTKPSRYEMSPPLFCFVCFPQVKCYALSANDDSVWRRKIEGESEHFCDVSGLQVTCLDARHGFIPLFTHWLHRT